VNLIRLSSVTHAFNQNQRINHLEFTKTPDGLKITAPANPNLAPSGHYMLFIVDDKGVPSVAKIIQLGLTVAADDRYGANKNKVLTVPAPGVLGNDGDADGHSLTVISNTQPTSGTLVLKSDGSFTYTPTKDPIGHDSFTYTVSNGRGKTDTATVDILEHKVYLPLIRG
jgi:Bacterial Ig domain/Galactose oxidase-like, Early set domain